MAFLGVFGLPTPFLCIHTLRLLTIPNRVSLVLMGCVIDSFSHPYVVSLTELQGLIDTRDPPT